MGSIVEKKNRVRKYRATVTLILFVFLNLVLLYLLTVFFDNGKLNLKTVIDPCVRLCNVVETAESMTILLNWLE